MSYITVPKGTKDVQPQESYKWHYVENAAKQTAALYNFREIRTPVFEHTELFTRSIGDGTDVVSKEMYTFLDKGGRSITLKPEGTAGVARSYVENTLESLTLPLKMFYITPVFRYENPQKGRLREHHQFGVEAFGSTSPYMDFEVISVAYDMLSKLGITGLLLKINCIGCPECRPRYTVALKEFLADKVGNMCGNCKERYEKNTLRILDCKCRECREMLKGAPVISDYICDDCKNHMDGLENCLKSAQMPFVRDDGIVRGLDYYTKTVFEFITDALGSQGTVCGGGRYDNLVESVGGKPTPGVGFGMGLERIIMLCESLGLSFGKPDAPTVYAACQSPSYLDNCRDLCGLLRKNGISAEYDLNGRSLKSQFKQADKLGAKFAAVIGESEAKDNTVTLKNLKDGTSAVYPIAEVAEIIKADK